MNRKTWLGWAASAALGGTCAAAAVFWGPPAGWLTLVAAALRKTYDLVGVTLIGLVPLGVWTISLMVRQFGQGGTAHPLTELNYAYCARNATLLGLLGTVIALASAGGRLAESVSKGSSAAVLQIAPLVSQALVSTIVGIVIALIADTGLHLIERGRNAKMERHGSGGTENVDAC